MSWCGAAEAGIVQRSFEPEGFETVTCPSTRHVSFDKISVDSPEPRIVTTVPPVTGPRLGLTSRILGPSELTGTGGEMDLTSALPRVKLLLEAASFMLMTLSEPEVMFGTATMKLTIVEPSRALVTVTLGGNTPILVATSALTACFKDSHCKKGRSRVTSKLTLLMIKVPLVMTGRLLGDVSPYPTAFFAATVKQY